MDESNRKRSAKDPSIEVQRLLSAVSRSRSICFVILGEDLRFRAVNQQAAAANGLAVEEHLGRQLRDVVGDCALRAQPAFQRVLRSGHATYLETSGKLLRQTYTGYWVNHVFPVGTPRRTVRQVGILAVEVTELRKLDELCANLTAKSLRTGTEDQVSLIRELRDSIGEYKAALGANLASLSNSTLDPERTAELFTQSLDLLDRRMQALIAAVASCFPIAADE